MGNQYNKAAKLLKRVNAATALLEKASLNSAENKQIAHSLKVEIRLACERGNTFAMGLLTNRVGSFEAKAGYLHYDYVEKEKAKTNAANAAALFKQLN